MSLWKIKEQHIAQSSSSLSLFKNIRKDSSTWIRQSVLRKRCLLTAQLEPPLHFLKIKNKHQMIKPNRFSILFFYGLTGNK
jgi:hypothetical protein